MHKLLILLSLLFFPLNVYAKDLYLDTLEIQNGTLSLPFEKYNTIYTVEIASSVETLDLIYAKDNDIEVDVLDNHDLKNDSVVTINLKKDKETISYELHILKDEEQVTEVFKENEPINDNFMYHYKIYIIPPLCFILILIAFKFLFLKHKK